MNMTTQKWLHWYLKMDTWFHKENCSTC